MTCAGAWSGSQACDLEGWSPVALPAAPVGLPLLYSAGWYLRNWWVPGQGVSKRRSGADVPQAELPRSRAQGAGEGGCEQSLRPSGLGRSEGTVDDPFVRHIQILSALLAAFQSSG